MIDCMICGRRLRLGIFFYTQYEENPMKFCCLKCFELAPKIEDYE